MEPILSQAEIERLNQLWRAVQPRLEAVETPLDFLAPTLQAPEPQPVAPPEPTPEAPTAPDDGYVCFESADDAMRHHLMTAAAHERVLEQSYACLATWAPERRASRLFHTLKARQRLLSRRLASACYLLTGRRLAAMNAKDCQPTDDWLLDVRGLFFEEAHAAERYRKMALQCGDPCLRELLQQAAAAKKEAADALMALVEEALLP